MRRNHDCTLRLELRALVAGEKPPAVGRALASLGPALLPERGGGRRVDDAPDTCVGSCVDGVHRAAYVHLEERRRVAQTEGVDTGGVVEHSATAHGVHERSWVEDVAVHGLGSQRA